MIASLNLGVTGLVLQQFDQVAIAAFWLIERTLSFV
jgi:hypothetical protein